MADKKQINYKEIFINNTFQPSVSGKKFATINPVNEEKIVEIAEGDKADIDLAVAAAKKAFQRGAPWRKMDASVRGKLLLKLAELVKRDREILATLDTMDNGKPYANALNEVDAGANKIIYFAGWCDKIEGQTIPIDGNFFTFTRREPVGVVACILPWNYPAMLALDRIASIFGCGCTMVMKPAEQTPLSALHIAALTKEAGFPDGVFNVVPGYGPTAGAALTNHNDVNKISFTGSTEVGRLIMKGAGDSNLKRVILELGGKSPLIIFADADLEKAAVHAHEAVMTNHGQCCCAGSRTFVQAEVYDKLLEKFTALAKQRSVGDPFDSSVRQGPQIDNDQFNKILELIESGKKQGARLMTGGKRHGDKGYFIEPTVFADVNDDMRIAKEEIFGPVQSIFKFSTLDEVIERANNTNYGLAAGVFTQDIDKALTVMQALEAGTVWVNCYLAGSSGAPFGGYKESGQGRESGAAALEQYTELKTVTIAIPEKLS